MSLESEVLKIVHSVVKDTRDQILSSQSESKRLNEKIQDVTRRLDRLDKAIKAATANDGNIPFRQNEKWTPSDDEHLAVSLTSLVNVESVYQGRTKNAIRARLRQLLSYQPDEEGEQ